MPQAYKLVAVLASTAAAGLSGAVIAGAADSVSDTTPTTPTTQQDGPGRGPGPGGPGRGGPGRGGPGAGETALTGDTKTNVEAAALAKVPGGTVVRSETDNGGVYEAHIRKSDGTEVEVKVDKEFNVTAVNAAPAGGPRGGHGGGPGGHRGGMKGNLTAVAKALDVTEAKLQSAVEAARPDKPAAPDPKTRGQDDAAEHTAREAAFYAAVAKTLGKSADAVQKAFEANRPAMPTR
jgi:hypothetical protein